MIKSLKNAQIADGLPRILGEQPWVKALSMAMLELHQKTMGYIAGSQIYTAIDTVAEEVLDALAVNWKIDWYDTGYDIEQKRRIVKTALNIRRTMGTAGAARTQADAIYPGTKLEEWFEYGGTHGRVNVSQAITVSCNYFFYEVGRLTGIKTLADYARQFGLGEYTGIEIGGAGSAEAKGSMATPEFAERNGLEWTDGQTLTAAIGQSYDLFTPLQLANYIATLVGSGQHYEAHLLKNVKSYDNSSVIYAYDKAPLNTVEMSDSTVQAVKEGMHNLTTGSLSYYFSNCVVSAGAKTGTAETGIANTNNGVFVCFAPYDDPQIAVAVVIEKGGSGAALASTAVDIVNSYFSQEEIGAVVIGVGQGIVVRQQATTGGTDIVAMLLQKFAGIKFSSGIFLADGFVVLSGLAVIGFGLGTGEAASNGWMLTLYSLITIYITSRVIAYLLNGASYDKLLFIISDHHQALKRFIIEDLDRSATYIKSKGMYTDASRDMIFLVVSRKEVHLVQHKIKEIDPAAFVVVTDAYETFGEGFKQFPDKNEIHAE